MERKNISTRDAFYARTGGVGPTGTLCEHGDPALVLDLVGSWGAPSRSNDDDVVVVLPRCIAAQLIGALTATVTHTSGEQAGQAFQDQARAALDTILPQLPAIHGTSA